MSANLGPHGVAVGAGLFGLPLFLWGAYDIATSKPSDVNKHEARGEACEPGGGTPRRINPLDSDFKPLGRDASEDCVPKE